MGSIIESDYMKQQFGMIGLNENQIAQIGGDKTVYDCVAGTEIDYRNKGQFRFKYIFFIG